VETVQEAMEEWGEDDADRHEKDEPTVKRVHASEDLSARRPRRIDRAHPAQEHGRVQEASLQARFSNDE
jgi:hypothetical protein